MDEPAGDLFLDVFSERSKDCIDAFDLVVEFGLLYCILLAERAVGEYGVASMLVVSALRDDGRNSMSISRRAVKDL
jgi:hypothetical protein